MSISNIDGRSLDGESARVKHISPVSIACRHPIDVRRALALSCVFLMSACATSRDENTSVVDSTDVAEDATEDDGSVVASDVAADAQPDRDGTAWLDVPAEADVALDVDTAEPVDVETPPEDIVDAKDATLEPDLLAPPDADEEPEVPEVPDSDDASEVPSQSGVLAIEVDGTAMTVGADGMLTVVLPALTPGSGAASVSTLVIRNAGSVPFTVNSASVLALNLDGTPSNPLVALGTVGEPVPALPAEVLPAAQVPTAKVTLPIEFKPETLQAAVDVGAAHATVLVSLTGADVEALTVRIEVPEFAPDINVYPLALEFTESTLLVTEGKTVVVENLGNAPLSLSSVSLSPPLGRFKVVGFSPIMLWPAGSDSATTYFFVTHKPIISSFFDQATLVIVSDDPDEPTTTVALSSTFEPLSGQGPCVVTWPGQEGGVLDFSDAKVGVPKLLTVQIENTGVGICTLNFVYVPEDYLGATYTVSVYSQSPSGDPNPVSNYPLEVGAGYKILIDIVYTTTSAAKSATLVLDYDEPNPLQIALPMVGGGPKPCLQMGPGTAAAPEPLQFAGNPGDAVTRHIALYSCGDAPVAIGPATIVDGPGGGEVFTAASLPTEIGEKSVVWFAVTAHFESDATDAVGQLTIPYSLEKGSATVTVPLRRRILGTTKLPTAEPGDASKYAGVVAGQAFTLDATASTAGSLPLNSNGYLWTLLSKPAGSTLIVAGPPGPPQQVVTPDVPGNYSFSLVVKSAGTLPWFSTEKTVEVNVK